MPIPEVTHLQFFLLAAISGGEMAGKGLREKLAEEGQFKSDPSFYQLMSRLENAGLVKGRYDQKVIDGQIIRERVYSITDAGKRAVADTNAFYRSGRQ